MIKLLAATTNDGFIARSKEDKSFDWTSIEDKQYYISELKKSDVIIIGSSSFATFDRYPKNSTWIVLTHHPEANQKFQNLESLPNFTGQAHPTSFYATSLPPIDLIQFLKAKNYQNIAVCGGQSVYTQFANAHLIDEYLITVEKNVMFGSGIPLFNQQTIKSKLIIKNSVPLSKTTIVEKWTKSKTKIRYAKPPLLIVDH